MNKENKLKRQYDLLPDFIKAPEVKKYITVMTLGENALKIDARESGRKLISEEIDKCVKDPEYFKINYIVTMTTKKAAPTAEPIKIIPMDDRYAVLADPEEEVTVGGIIIPDAAKEKQQKGTVVAVGPGKDGGTMHLKLGDRVAFGKYAGQEYLHDDGKTYLMMRQTDIFAIVDLA